MTSHTPMDAPARLPNPGQLAETFVDLARAVTEGADTVDLFTMLSERTVRLLPVEASGLLVIDAAGDLQIIGASSYSAEVLDLFQVQNDVGPCRECSRTGRPVVDVELADDGPWPEFAALVRSHGFNAVYALPLSARGVSVGALNLFTVAPLDSQQLVVAQALADAATMALLQSDPHHDLAVVSRRLYDAVEARNAVEQAKGVLCQRFGLDPTTALRMLRTASREAQLGLSEAADAIVGRVEPAALSSALARLGHGTPVGDASRDR